jgi:heme o synthase
MELLRQILGLIKVRIALAVVLSSAVGYLVVSHGIDNRLIWLSLGVFILASGSAAINQLQEWRFDLLMERTSGRALPSGTIRRQPAILLASGLSVGGVLILFITCGWLSALLGLFTLAWYNLVYTPLKTKTSFALFIGALVGAVPPAIGFTTAGGTLASEKLLLLSLFYFIWQVPHFLLLLLRYGDEYLKAGFKPLNKYLNLRQLCALTFVWIIALIVIASFLSLAGLIRRDFFIILQITVSLIFAGLSLPVLNPSNHEKHLPRMFRLINGFMLLISHFVMLDQII